MHLDSIAVLPFLYEAPRYAWQRQAALVPGKLPVADDRAVLLR